MTQPIGCQAIITSVRTRRDNSLGISIETPELDNQAMLVFLRLRGINLKMILQPLDETEVAPPLEVKSELKQKTYSQRIRATLFCLYSHELETGKLPKGALFETFYAEKCEKFIEFIKSKLPEK